MCKCVLEVGRYDVVFFVGRWLAIGGDGQRKRASARETMTGLAALPRNAVGPAPTTTTDNSRRRLAAAVIAVVVRDV